MKIDDDSKSNIQFFTYYLFKGTLDSRLIFHDKNYLDVILGDKDLLFNCFKVFTANISTYNYEITSKIVSNYILGHLDQEETYSSEKILKDAEEKNAREDKYWIDFLKLAKYFCYNSFPIPVNSDYILDLNGCGTDSVPTFAVWTNIIRIDNKGNSTNAEEALKRANDRIKLWDNIQPDNKFEEWELEQEIY